MESILLDEASAGLLLARFEVNERVAASGGAIFHFTLPCAGTSATAAGASAPNLSP